MPVIPLVPSDSPTLISSLLRLSAHHLALAASASQPLKSGTLSLHLSVLWRRSHMAGIYSDCGTRDIIGRLYFHTLVYFIGWFVSNISHRVCGLIVIKLFGKTTSTDRHTRLVSGVTWRPLEWRKLLFHWRIFGACLSLKSSEKIFSGTMTHKKSWLVRK